jgi:hypothetical protein
MAKSTISLVSVQKPTSNTPFLQRRNRLTSSLEQQIDEIGSFREGRKRYGRRYAARGRRDKSAPPTGFVVWLVTGTTSSPLNRLGTVPRISATYIAVPKTELITWSLL